MQKKELNGSRKNREIALDEKKKNLNRIREKYCGITLFAKIPKKENKTFRETEKV